jgi:hypothetical protein
MVFYLLPGSVQVLMKSTSSTNNSMKRIENGKMERIRKEKKVLDMCRCAGRYSRGWLGIGLVVIAACGLTGCSHLKTGVATSGVVGASSVLGLASVPTAVLGGVTAATVSALTAGPKIQAAEIKADTVVSEAPDNLWTVIKRLGELGGIGLILALVIVPLLTGWLIPGPTKLNRREKG